MHGYFLPTATLSYIDNRKKPTFDTHTTFDRYRKLVVESQSPKSQQFGKFYPPFKLVSPVHGPDRIFTSNKLGAYNIYITISTLRCEGF